MLQARLEGEPSSKTPRVPPAQSPGITPVDQEAESCASVTKAALTAAVPTDQQLDDFVTSYVDGIVSEVKSELVADAFNSRLLRENRSQADASEISIPSVFTEGSSAQSHRGRPGTAKASPHRAHPSHVHQPAPSASSANNQQQPDESEAACSDCQTAVGRLDVQSRHAIDSESDEQDQQQDGVAETGQLSKEMGRDDAQLKAADTDAPKVVAEIVQELLESVSQRPHATKVISRFHLRANA